MENLPHLVVDEPKRSKITIFGIVILSVLVLTLPIGIFLVSERTQLAPQAAVIEPRSQALVTGVFLESSSRVKGADGTVPIDVYLKSEVDAINLAAVQIKYDSVLLSLEKIATSSAETLSAGKPTISKWLEVSINETQGMAKITSGVTNPGLKTNPGFQEKAYLATLIFRPKSAGSTVLTVDSGTQILRNSDSQNIYSTSNDLVLNLQVSPEPRVPITESKNPQTGNSPLIALTSPGAGTNYSYFKPLEVIWGAFNVDRIARINLYINDELFGSVAANIPNSGLFNWQIEDNLPLAYIQYSNTFKLEIIGVSKNGEQTKSTSAPFGILGLEQIPGGITDPAAFLANPLAIQDASRLLANYLVFPVGDKSIDLNKDDVINELDFYLLRENLLGRGVIK